MTLDDILSGASLVASIIAVALGLRRHNSKAHEAKMTARREQGLAYARAAWDVVQARKTAPGAMRAALLEMRRGLLEQLRADEMEDEARALRRRGRIRQVRALEQLTGVPPADVRRTG